MSIRCEEWFNKLPINASILRRESALYDQLVTMIDALRRDLNARPYLCDIAFTPHDFEHHIKNVLGNLSDLLQDNIEQLSAEELFCLQCAGVLHDFVMCFDEDCRKRHSWIDALIVVADNKEIKPIIQGFCDKLEWLIESGSDLETKDAKDTLGDIATAYASWIPAFITDVRDRQAIASIILGHSNIKGENGGEIDTLSPSLYDFSYKATRDTYGQRRPMCVRAMAALLRWADELDCTDARIASCTKPEFKKEEERQKSEAHWRKLELISELSIGGGGVVLTACANTNEQDFSLLIEIDEKLQKEWRVINRVLQDVEMAQLFVGPKTEDIIVFESDKDGSKLAAYRSYRERIKKARDAKEEKIDSDTLKVMICNRVREMNLLQEGHYCVNASGKIYSRNHLDCSGILSDPVLLSRISQAMINYLYSGDFDRAANIKEKNVNRGEYFLVGMAHSGALLAAHMAVLTGIPYTCAIPDEKSGLFTEWEKLDLDTFLDEKQVTRIILVLGANRTGTAVKSIVERILERIKNRGMTVSVVGLVNREYPMNGEQKLEDILREQNVQCGFLMTAYPLDRCIYTEPRTCPYQGRCITEEKA